MARKMKQIGRLIFATAIFTVVLVLMSSAAIAQSTPVFINEIHYDNFEGDVNEAIEVAGAAGVDLTGWTLLLYNGSDGTNYNILPLSGVIPDQQNGFGTLAFNYPANAIQNGNPDGIALVDPTNVVVQFLSYEGSFLAVGGAADGLVSVDVGVNEVSTTPAGESLQLSGVGTTLGDFAWGGPTIDSFDSVNSSQAFEAGNIGDMIGQCGDTATPIHLIQGAGAFFDPNFGGLQTIEGVVTGNFPGLRGFYVQEEEEVSHRDGNPATSEGIFVFMSTEYTATQITMSNTVRVRGLIAEYETGSSSQTQIKSPTVLDCGSASTTIEPTEITLPVGSIADFERYEGMLLRFPQQLTISEYFEFDDYGQVVLALPSLQFAQDRQFVGTAVVEPGTSSQAIAEQNILSQITLDDGRSSQFPDPVIHPNGAPFDLTNRFRGGDMVTGVTGILDHTHGSYRIQPTAQPTYTSNNPRPTQPAGVGGTLKVAGLNVYNFFTTLNTGQRICGPSGTIDCRGANDPQEFSRQITKTIAVLVGLDADIAGLVELENNPSASLQSLVDGLNAQLGAGTYDFIDTGTLGTDAIKVGLIYKPGKVTPHNSYAVLDTAGFTDPLNSGEQKSRPALAQTFADNESGELFTVVVNHLKSRRATCGSADNDPLQGGCNITRKLAAEALVDWLATDPTASNDTDVLIIGDLNAYDKEDPIDTIILGADNLAGTSDDFVDMIAHFQGEFAYSYVFDGQYGYLDYAMASQSMQAQVTGVVDWHINADEPDILDYDTTDKSDAQDALYEPNAYRAADHDPVLIGLALNSGVPHEQPVLTMGESNEALLLEKLEAIEARIEQLQQEVVQIKELVEAMNE